MLKNKLQKYIQIANVIESDAFRITRSFKQVQRTAILDDKSRQACLKIENIQQDRAS